MKAIKLFRLSFLMLGIVSTLLSLQSCDPDDDDHMLYKPNIYIYPQENIHLDVHIDFPLGGKVVASIPDYKNGWDVSVASTGLIDNKFTYLFYESIQPNIWQTKSGWVVKKSDLKDFFKENMSLYGFAGQEIQDFIDYWIPRLNEHDYYSICPQTSNTINKAVQLRFSKEPERILRLYYMIKGRDNSSKNELVKPEMPGFERKGYFVTEWGVVL
jgi:hypothetical protein